MFQRKETTEKKLFGIEASAQEGEWIQFSWESLKKKSKIRTSIRARQHRSGSTM